MCRSVRVTIQRYSAFNMFAFLRSWGLCATIVGLSVWEIHAISISHANAASGRSMRSFVPPWVAQANVREGILRYIKDSPEGPLYSQEQEDKFAESHYFHNLHNGTFLEMGALDGVHLSNTKFFEESRGWRGLLIEPNRVEYEKIFNNRPEAIAVNAAVCAKNQDVHFISKRLAGSAGTVGGIWEFMSEEFRRHWYGSVKDIPEEAELVPCSPLASIIETFSFTHIDFFSLDVEGAELEVLETLDLSAVHINVIVVEQDGGNPAKDEAVRQKLLSNNFEMDYSMKDTVAGNRNDWFVNRHFRRSEAST